MLFSFVADDNEIIFLSSGVNGPIGDHATYFFLSSEIGAAPIPDDKNLHRCRQVRTGDKCAESCQRDT